MIDPSEPSPERRGFLRDLLRPIRAARAIRSGEARRRGPPIARPPWSLPEEEFLSTCERCHACVEVCPRDAIQAAPVGLPGGEGFPVVFPNRAACDLCGDCAVACPSGAIRQGLAPRDARLGTARILDERCVLGKGETCSACLDACPFPGEAIVISPGFFPHVKRDACVGCGLCVNPCPGQAIHVAPR